MKSLRNKSYRLAELTKDLDVLIKGDPDCLIHGIAPIQQALPGQITFLSNTQYRKFLAITQASAVIISKKDAELCSGNAIISHNPYYTYAKIAEFFNEIPTNSQGIHALATIGENCHIHSSVNIGANTVIGNNVKIAANVNIGANCFVGDNSEIDESSQLDAHVTLYHHTNIGKRSRLASGVVIGSDGFGFANQQGVWHKVPQLGGVSIGDDVDVGANTTIDRGAVEDTVISNGVKLDNLIQIGHNVQIGENTIMAGCTAVAGSTIIGKNCMIGGASCFAGHITIADNVMITGMTAVTKSILEPGIYSSGIVGAVPNQEFRKNNARFHRLENLMQRVKKLENAMQQMIERK